MLVRLLDIGLILVHALFQLVLVVQIVLQLLLLLHIRQHNFHIQIVLTTSFSLIKLFRDQGGISLTSVRAIVPRVSARRLWLGGSLLNLLLLLLLLVDCILNLVLAVAQ